MSSGRPLRPRGWQVEGQLAPAAKQRSGWHAKPTTQRSRDRIRAATAHARALPRAHQQLHRLSRASMRFASARSRAQPPWGSYATGHTSSTGGTQWAPQERGGGTGGGGRGTARDRTGPARNFPLQERCPALSLQTADNGPCGRTRMRPEGRKAPPPVRLGGILWGSKAHNGRAPARCSPGLKKRAHFRPLFPPGSKTGAPPHVSFPAALGPLGAGAARSRRPRSEWRRRPTGNARMGETTQSPQVCVRGTQRIEFQTARYSLPGRPPRGGGTMACAESPADAPAGGRNGPRKRGGRKGHCKRPRKGGATAPKGRGGTGGGGGRQGHRRRPIRAPRKEFCHKEWCPALPLQTADNGPRGRPRMRPEGRIRGELQQQPWPRKPLQIHAQMPR